MYDKFNREINYLRISVTECCNLRCQYCAPAFGVELMDPVNVLSFDEILEVVKIAVEKGINKIRITGGEPLVRKGIVDLVRMISEIEGVEDLGMTTNGLFLGHYAEQLKEAGLNRINVSLDTINNEKFTEVTRGGKLSRVLSGIEKAKEVGLIPIKLNCVVTNSSDEAEAVKVRKYALENGLQVRFIHQMDLVTGLFSKVEGGDGGDCSKCNRLRLTATGDFKPCLFNDSSFNIREYGIEGALEKAVECKPRYGTNNKSGKFYNLGG